MTNDISLSSAMRSNLLSLQDITGLMDRTQNRLATGLKVNSAIDNPSSYYTAKSLDSRADDLDSLLDSMGQAVQTIQAANEGIEAVTSFVEQAKSVVNQALEAKTSDANAPISSFSDSYNELMKQITNLAHDASYKGINLLDSGTLEVTFNEGGTSTLKITGFDTTAEGLLKDAKTSEINTTAWTEQTVSADYNNVTLGTTVVATGKDLAVDDIIQTADGKLYRMTNAITGDDTTPITAADVELVADWDSTKEDYTTTDFVLADGKVYSAYDNTKSNVKTIDAQTAAWTTTTTVAQLKEYSSALAAATSTLRTEASTLGSAYSILQTRQDFTDKLINVLSTGADNLTLADMNEESANMLALQTQQQLAINSLSLASQAAQSVLKLF